MKTIIIAACILGTTSAMATAAPVVIKGDRAATEEFFTERVSFADLNISSQAGLDTLRRRVRAAATRVCESVNPEPLMASVESLGCYRRTMGDSYAQIDSILAARGTGAAIAAVSVTVSAR